MAEQRQLADQFITQFKSSKSRIETRLQDARTADAYDALQADLAGLRKELTDAMEYLAGYDQRQLDLQLKDLERAVGEARAANVPVQKFSFKRKKATSKESPVVSPAPALGTAATTPPGPASVSASNLQVSSSPNALDIAVTTPPARNPVPTPNLQVSSLSDVRIALSALGASPLPGTGLSLSSLQSCLVNLLPAPSDDVGEGGASFDSAAPRFGSIHARHLSSCVLLLPPVDGSVFLETCESCVVVAAARQFRMHQSSDVVVLLHVTSTPIIEDCTAVRVGAYPLDTGLPRADSKHLEMQDFGWLQGGRSPNWSVIPDGDAAAWETRVLELANVGGGVTEEMLHLAR